MWHLIILLAVILVIFVMSILPIIINIKLAESRGQNMALMVILTIFFSWIITLVLLLLPKAEARN
jgi:hypothetical protein